MLNNIDSRQTPPAFKALAIANDDLRNANIEFYKQCQKAITTGDKVKIDKLGEFTVDDGGNYLRRNSKNKFMPLDKKIILNSTNTDIIDKVNTELKFDRVFRYTRPIHRAIVAFIMDKDLIKREEGK